METADARDEKLRGPARVIRHFRPTSFEFSVSTKDYSEVVQPSAPRGLNPRFVRTFGTVALTVRYLPSQKVKTKVDFIFDEQDGVSADIVLLFERMVKSLPKDAG